jgi:hypothetical protein
MKKYNIVNISCLKKTTNIWGKHIKILIKILEARNVICIQQCRKITDLITGHATFTFCNVCRLLLYSLILSSIAHNNYDKSFTTTSKHISINQEQMNYVCVVFLRRKTRDIMIAWSSLSSPCNKLVSNHLKIIIMKRYSCKTRGIIMKTIFLELCPILTYNVLLLLTDER